MPKLAQDAHVLAMESTVRAALEEAGICKDQLEGVAVTVGPGLSLCLQASSSDMPPHTAHENERRAKRVALHGSSMSSKQVEVRAVRLGPACPCAGMSVPWLLPDSVHTWRHCASQSQ